MKADSKVILVGGFKEIIELCEACEKHLIGIIDNNIDEEFNDYQLLGTDDNAADLYKEYKDVPLVITPDTPSVRKKLVKYYKRIGFGFTSLIHPGAMISKYVKLGQGVIIQNGVNVSTNVNIGNFVKLNTYSNIMHDSVVGDFSTVSPNAVILGRVKINESCYIGANATILPDVNIEKLTIIGAAAVVTRNVARCKTVAGNPAHELSKNNKWVD